MDIEQEKNEIMFYVILCGLKYRILLEFSVTGVLNRSFK